MADNVVDGHFITRLDIPADRVLRKALDADLESVVVLGYDRDGEEYFAGSIADGGTVVWLLERAKGRLLSVKEDEHAT